MNTVDAEDMIFPVEVLPAKYLQDSDICLSNVIHKIQKDSTNSFVEKLCLMLYA